MYTTFVLSLLLALWCGLSMAKDEMNSVVYNLDDARNQFAYLINPSSFNKPSLGQGRWMGSSLNWSLKDYLFPNKDTTKYKVEEYDDDEEFEVDADEDLQRDPYLRPQYYPGFNNFPCFPPYCPPPAAFRYPTPYYGNAMYTPRKLGKSKGHRRFQYY